LAAFAHKPLAAWAAARTPLRTCYVVGPASHRLVGNSPVAGKAVIDMVEGNLGGSLRSWEVATEDIGRTGSASVLPFGGSFWMVNALGKKMGL